jgi:hypothetical protein
VDKQAYHSHSSTRSSNFNSALATNAEAKDPGHWVNSIHKLRRNGILLSSTAKHKAGDELHERGKVEKRSYMEAPEN